MAHLFRTGVLVVATVGSMAMGQASHPGMVTVTKGVSFQAPANWRVNKPAYRNAVVLTIATAKQNIAHLAVTTETRRSHAEAMQRLRDIVAESSVKAHWVSLGGWPAVAREEKVVLPHTEQAEQENKRE